MYEEELFQINKIEKQKLKTTNKLQKDPRLKVPGSPQLFRNVKNRQ